MKLLNVSIGDLAIVGELSRTRRDKVFQEHLMASIKEVGLVEPLKVAAAGRGRYVVVDGVLRLEAIIKIQEEEPFRFQSVPAYLVEFRRRFELRFQGDIFQDLLPSQLASLVEHLHKNEGVRKKEIARFIGISSATLRNYTGLWRLIQRGGLFAEVVRLMDFRILPASNPYAWLRLNNHGIQLVLQKYFAKEVAFEEWLQGIVASAGSGRSGCYSIQFVEEITGSLPSECYRERQEVRSMKQRFGELRSPGDHETKCRGSQGALRIDEARKALKSVQAATGDPVLREAAIALERAL